MTQEYLNQVKRECFAEVIKFADELETEEIHLIITRSRSFISAKSNKLNIDFFFEFYQYDTTLEAGQEFHKQFNKFKISCKTNN